ncbi:hypothetical protein [uncultured Sphingomonas sp.]|uniref:hypothetical protein n=1 Tax=uncultured Sphingomonas sp. TaxID=158754 RepID=UPI0035CBBFA5
MPELFTRRLADKDAEAVANKAHFKGQKGAARLADDDYRIKMEGIFAECRRVLKDDGIMTVMFTHKDTGAWDALAMSLMDAGFVITVSWPVNTEASGSLHIKDKAAANSTIFLVCRPREEKQGDAVYWEDVEPEVAQAVKARVGEYQAAGISGVDLYLASFGPALEAFSRHWPLTRGRPATEPKKKRRTQGDMFEEFDPYAVRPEDALNAARREVKAWRLAQLASAKAQADMDGPTAFYVLAWDAFKAVSFPYDEALRLARAVGVDLEEQVVGRLAEKKGSEIKLWDSATPLARSLSRKRVQICEFPDGRIEIRHGERVLPYTIFDKMRQVNQAAIVESKQLGGALALAQAIQAVTPHHRQRNNNEPARSSRSVGVFASKATAAAEKVDGRKLCTPKLKRGPRLSNEELIARGLGEYAK